MYTHTHTHTLRHTHIYSILYVYLYIPAILCGNVASAYKTGISEQISHFLALWRDCSRYNDNKSIRSSERVLVGIRT